MGLACLANGATLLLTGLLGRLRGAAVVNPVESIGLYPLPLQLLLAGLIAPAAAELLFLGMTAGERAGRREAAARQTVREERSYD